MSIKSVIRNYLCENCLQIQELNDKISLLNSRNKQLSRAANFIEKLLEFKPYNESILKIKMLKNVPIVITSMQDFNYKGQINRIFIKAYAFNYDHFEKVQELYAGFNYRDESIYIFPTSITIHDFLGKMNCGYGSLVMEQFLTYVNNLKIESIEKIQGMISPVDADHWDLLFHFYRKFGFEITDDKHIILKLTKGKNDETNNS